MILNGLFMCHGRIPLVPDKQIFGIDLVKGGHDPVRVTLAMIEAAAMEILRLSPLITACWEMSESRVNLPSTSRKSGVLSRFMTARFMEQREAARMLVASISLWSHILRPPSRPGP